MQNFKIDTIFIAKLAAKITNCPFCSLFARNKKKLAQFHIYQIVGHQNLNCYIWGVGQVLRYIDLKVYLILNTVTLVAICIIQRGLVKT